ncbi:MAG TPA: phosphatidate cytidylyltransferase [Candidatus Dormibacteraeota bacterium]
MTVEAKPAPRSWRPSPLMVRIVFGTLLVVAIMALVYVGLPGLWVLVLGFSALGLWEFGQLSGHMGFRAPSWLLYPLGAYLAFSGTLLKAIDLQLVLSIALVAGLAAFLFLPGQREGLGRWALGLAGAIYIGLPMNYYLLLFTSSPAHGRAWVIFTVLTAAVSDIAALLVGGAFGRTPFFPAISPKKTVEGAIAGVLFCVPAMLLGAVTGLGIPIGHAVVIGLLIGVSAELGDLVESQMKRVAGVKDSSGLIPGHGGMLDRMDSVLFPPIVVFVYATVFHLL